MSSANSETPKNQKYVYIDRFFKKSESESEITLSVHEFLFCKRPWMEERKLENDIKGQRVIDTVEENRSVSRKLHTSWRMHTIRHVPDSAGTRHKLHIKAR